MNIHTNARIACIEALRERFDNRLTTNQTIRDRHGLDESFHELKAPDAVVFPQSTEEVSEIVKLCAAHKMPIIPFGTGTSLEGHINAIHGGISIDMSEMNEVLRVNAEDLDCTVQAGVTRKQLNEYIKDTGLMFPIDPGANASIGGMTATRASGTNAVRYGTMRENVLGVKAVMPDGIIVDTSRRARKSAAGYDLTRLLVGSEGTLAVITEITVRLYGIPEAVSAGVCTFEMLEGAVNATILTIQSGLPIARIELIDEVQVEAINEYSGFDYPLAPTLWFEFHGTEAGVKEQAEWFGEIAEEFGGRILSWSTLQEERNKLWSARHNAYYANMQKYSGTRGMPTDVCVPISRLAECILETQKDVEASFLPAPIVGHVGDGNFHLSIMLDPEKEEHLAEADRLNSRLVDRAHALEGTCTGEHGIGLGKIGKLEKELPTAVPLMHAIKNALDPDNIMNPGKVINLDG